jgi:hypothetical protein
MCYRPHRCWPAPAYGGGQPTQIHYRFIQTTTVTTTTIIEVDVVS